jgi:glycerol-3-phosphate acyltransferase PlsY
MKFRGGKGLACLGGCILAFNPLVFLVMLACEIVIVLAANYICFVPMTASVAFAIVYCIMSRDLYGAVLLGAVAVVIICKHIVNIKRIREGKEARFSYLWSKDKETARLKEKYGQEE